jgi:hypothetical protein
MKHQSKFDSEQQSQQTGAEQQTQAQSPLEFATPEELLRYDAARTAVPAGIAQRLQKSAGELSPPKSSWWKRLLGGTNP